MVRSAEPISLPRPKLRGELSVAEAIKKRRSVRDFLDATLSLGEVSQLLWAAQGMTAPDGARAVPSAGALYPLETYLAVGQVRGLDVGAYKYHPRGHALTQVTHKDLRGPMAETAEQEWIADASVILAWSAVYGRTTRTYGERGRIYVHMEVGHAVQSASLQAVALNLGSVVVGAIDEGEVRRMLRLPKYQVPLCLMPVGKPA
jgi:SagB-type dehydrogenase family enzyme